MLTAKRVERTTKPGRYRDGLVKGLLLQISESGAKSWVLRYELHGREHMMGLGSAADFNLKEARERARDARQLLADGIDPLASKRAAKAAAKAADAKALSFRDAAQKYFDQHEAKWRNAAHRDQFLARWRPTSPRTSATWTRRRSASPMSCAALSRSGRRRSLRWIGYGPHRGCA